MRKATTTTPNKFVDAPSTELDIARRFRRPSCRHRLPEVAKVWPRPHGHLTFDILFSRSCRTAIIHLWKNAGTATRRYLAERSSCNYTVLADYASFRMPKGFSGRSARARKAMHAALATSNLTILAFVRDPVSRFLSGFHEVLGRHSSGQYKPLGHALFGMREPPRANRSRDELFGLVERSVAYEAAFSPVANATDFSPKDWTRNFHMAPQAAFLSSWLGEPLHVDYIGAISRLQSELDFLTAGSARSGANLQVRPAPCPATGRSAVSHGPPTAPW
jgi:hypothetical protein